MSRATGPPPPATRAPAGGRRGMRAGTGIFLITAGAILRFALSAGSPHGLNVHIVGVILILAGGLGLLLPRIARGAPRDRLRRWVRPDQPRAYDEPPTVGQGADGNRPALVQDHSIHDQRPPLTTDLVGRKITRQAEPTHGPKPLCQLR